MVEMENSDSIIEEYQRSRRKTPLKPGVFPDLNYFDFFRLSNTVNRKTLSMKPNMLIIALWDLKMEESNAGNLYPPASGDLFL